MALVQQHTSHSHKPAATVLGWGGTRPSGAGRGWVFREDAQEEPGLALTVKNRVFIQCLHS